MQAVERQSLTGIGPVRIGPSWAYAYWQYMYDEDDDGQHASQRWTIRLSIDDFERLNLSPYQWTWLQLPGREPESVFFRGNRDNPPFTVLSFERPPHMTEMEATA
jgi:hypothetical protein